MITKIQDLRKAINTLNNNVEFTTLRNKIARATKELNEFKALHEPKLLALLLSTNPTIKPRRGAENVEITLKTSWLCNEEALQEYYKLCNEYWKNEGFNFDKGVCAILVKENNLFDLKQSYYPIGAKALGLDYEKIKLHYDLCKGLEKLIDDITKPQ